MAATIIIGGAAGVARITAEGMLARGDDVLLVDPSAEPIAGGQGTGRCRTLALAPDDPAMPAAAVATAIEAFGTIDCVMIAAAAMRSAPLPEWTPAMWDAIVATNLRMPFFLARAAAPHLARSDNASLLLISSTAALRGQPGVAPFQASRAALGGLMRSLTAELGPAGVRVNCILPGWIDTPFSAAFWAAQPDPAAARASVDAQIPLRRQGMGHEVASFALFLSSAAGRYIAGSEIVIDGGYTAV